MPTSSAFAKDMGRVGVEHWWFSSVQFSRSVVSYSLQLHELHHARPPCPSPTPSSLRLTSIESVMPSSHLILCHPLILLPPILPSIKVFPNESTLHMRWPKYWSFSFSIIPSKEIRGLISFRMDWLDLLPVQGTLKSLLQHHSSKASILRHSAFFTVQLSHPYMTTGSQLYWGLISVNKRQTFPSGPYTYFFSCLFCIFCVYLQQPHERHCHHLHLADEDWGSGRQSHYPAGRMWAGSGQLQSPFCWPLSSVSFQISYMCNSSACFFPHDSMLSPHIDKNWL